MNSVFRRVVCSLHLGGGNHFYTFRTVQIQSRTRRWSSLRCCHQYAEPAESDEYWLWDYNQWIVPTVCRSLYATWCRMKSIPSRRSSCLLLFKRMGTSMVGTWWRRCNLHVLSEAGLTCSTHCVHVCFLASLPVWWEQALLSTNDHNKNLAATSFHS